MFIRSERLFLRPAWPEDSGELLARITDEGVVRNLASAPWPYTSEDARAFISREPNPRCPSFLVTLPGAEGARIVGSVGLHEVDGEVELGYWIARPHWGQGYASEAARAVLSLARTLGHKRIVAHHFVDNPASGRVLRKLGFCPTGVSHRASEARDGLSPALGYALDFAGPCDCDDDADGGDRMKRMA